MVLALLLLALTVQVLALLLGSHSAQNTFALILLDLLSGQFAVLGLLLLLNAAELLDLLITDVANLTQNLTTEVGSRDELIAETQELVEQGQSCGVIGRGGQVNRELNALLRDGLINPRGWMLDIKSGQCNIAQKGPGTYFNGLSTGWSVTIKYSKSLPAFSIA